MENEKIFFNQLNNCKLDSLLMKLNEYAIKIFDSNNISIIFSTYKNQIFKSKINEIRFNNSLSLWNIIDIAYYAILHATDYKHIELDDQQFHKLLIMFHSYNDDNVEDEYDLENDLFLYFNGFLGEQFKFQNIQIIFNNLYRELYILFVLSKKNDNSQDFKTIIKDITGYDWNIIISSLLMLTILYYKKTYYEDLIEKNIYNIPKETLHILNNIIKKYTCTYNEVRVSSIKRQILTIKPFIQTSKGNIICCNFLSILLLVEHCIYWIIRDHLHNDNGHSGKKSTSFTNYFGYLFEEYLCEFLTDVLPPDSFTKITDSNNKIPDWKIKLGKYTFYIEQKSAIPSIDSKQQNSNLNSFSSFIKNNILKGFKQLKSLELRENEKNVIKILLVYDNYVTELSKSINYIKEYMSDNNDYLFWIMNIDEFETLFSLYNDNEELFNKVIDNKLDDINKNNDSAIMISLYLKEHKIFKNKYMDNEKFTQYEEIIHKTIKSLEK